MNIMTLPTFDDALADSQKLAAVAQTVKTAMAYAESALERAEGIEEDALLEMHWARRAGLLEGAVEVLHAFLVQIKGQVKPDGDPS